MPTSCDGVERQPEDPRVQTTQGRQSRLQSEEKKPAAVRKRLIPQIGQILHEGGPGEKRGEKMRFEERAVGRGEKHPLQGFAVPRKNHHRIDGRPDGTPPVVEESRVSRRFFACRTPHPAGRPDAFRPVEDPERKTPRPPPAGDEVGAERLAHGRFSCSVEFGYRHEGKSDSGLFNPVRSNQGGTVQRNKLSKADFSAKPRAFENRPLRPKPAPREKIPFGKKKKEKRKREKGPRASPSLPKERRRRALRTDERSERFSRNRNGSRRRPVKSAPPEGGAS